MIKFCPRLALSILILISFGFIFTTKVQAKAPYGFTLKVGSASSQIKIEKTAIDTAGDIYYAGSALGDNIPFNPIDGVSDVKSATGLEAIFLTKINNDGTYGYTNVYDGDGQVFVNSLKTDTNGSAYIAGSFQGVLNFDPVGSTDTKDSGDQRWSFLTKLDTNGAYQYTLTWPSVNLSDMAIDTNNNVYIAGTITATDSAQLDPIEATDNKVVTDESMGFYLKINSDGTYGYSRSFISADQDGLETHYMAVDANSNVYLTGLFSGTVNFNGSGGTDNKTSNGLNDIFLNKYDSSGNYMFTYTFGGIDNEFDVVLSIDHSSNVYLAGMFNDAVNFDPTGGIDSKIATTTEEPFLTKINSGGSYGKTLTWDTNNITIGQIAFDTNNLVYILGSAPGNINFDPTGGVNPGVGFGSTDAFMTVLNADETYNYTYVWGGSGDEEVLNASFDGFNNLYLGGDTLSPSVNFNPTGTGADDIKTLLGTTDGFLMKLLTSQTISLPPAGSSNSSPVSDEAQHSFTCTGPSPKAPILFQITTVKDKATVYTAPVADPTSGYTISYGPDINADMFNVSFDNSDKSGVVVYTINYLDKKTTYYFKIRANNGCMPGEWSKILSAKTLSTGSFTSYYSPTNSFDNPTAGGQCTSYTVKSGDSLWTIAQKILGSGKKYISLLQSNSSIYPTLKKSPVIRTGWKLNVGC